jgi:glucose-6-phosphate 1-dehydrogenase
VHTVFDEEQIFRIDHFLGKEAALNILAFRFANGLFEPIWSRNQIDHVQIDVPETLGIEDRVSFYESTGAFRDMVVTHLLQVLAIVAMEPPTALTPRAINEEKNKVFSSLLPLNPSYVIRGQYRGYRELDAVADDSNTETFVALRCEIDNWRWAGVPFFLRTGKRLAEGPTSSRSLFVSRLGACSRPTPASAPKVRTISRSTSPSPPSSRSPSTASDPGPGCRSTSSASSSLCTRRRMNRTSSRHTSGSYMMR